MMKTTYYLLLFLFTLPLVGIAQNNENTNFKNQFDLDIYFLGVEGSYKGRVSNKLFIGLGLGGVMVRPIIDSKFDLGDNFIELIKLRPFLDFQLNNYVHIETGLAIAGTFSNIDDDAGYSIGIESGFFLKLWKIELGVRPSLLFYKSNDANEKFKSPKLTTSLLIIKIPLSRW